MEKGRSSVPGSASCRVIWLLLHDVDVETGQMLGTVDTVHPGGLGHTWNTSRMTFTGGDHPRLVASANVALTVYDGASLDVRATFNPALAPISSSLIGRR